MNKLFFETEQNGFYGTYYENPNGADCAMIGLFGDDPNDYMAKCGAKWLHKHGVNVLCMSPGNTITAMRIARLKESRRQSNG